MSTPAKDSQTEVRSSLIQAVTSPLNMFALTVVVVEAILGVVVSQSDLTEGHRFFLICMMLILIFAVTFMVGFITYNRPRHLSPEMASAIQTAIDKSSRVEEFIESPALAEYIKDVVDGRLTSAQNPHSVRGRVSK